MYATAGTGSAVADAINAPRQRLGVQPYTRIPI